MKTQVKVYAKAQNRLALGIIKAFYALNPQSTLADLKKAFPDGINPDCGSKQIFMSEKEIKKHIDSGEEWYASARGYFVGDDEWLVMANGEKIGVVSMWSKPSIDRLIEQAKKYGIEAEESDEKRGTYRLEFLEGNKFSSTEERKIDNQTESKGKGMSSFNVSYDEKEYSMSLMYKANGNGLSEYSTLTDELDNLQGKELTLENIYKLTLWKTGRFPFITPETLAELNSLKDERVLNEEKTKTVLGKLLDTKGVGLPMASTYLRFINPDVYQIIDFHAYRAAFDYEKDSHDYEPPYGNLKKITVYLDYLRKLREIADSGYHGLSTEFCNLDRFLYNFDKEAFKIHIQDRRYITDDDWEDSIHGALNGSNPVKKEDMAAIKKKGMYEFVVSYENHQYSTSLKYNASDQYYPSLTEELDKLKGKELTLEDIYKITLWKIGRFPFMTPETLAELNSLKDERVLNEEKTKAVLCKLLDTKGVGLPMASTYLRFINPDVYQIIDFRAYRAAFEYNIGSEEDYKNETSKEETYK